MTTRFPSPPDAVASKPPARPLPLLACVTLLLAGAAMVAADRLGYHQGPLKGAIGVVGLVAGLAGFGGLLAIWAANRFRASVRRLMVVTLVVAACCGAFTSWRAHQKKMLVQRIRDSLLLSQMSIQREATFKPLHVYDPILAQFVSAEPLQFRNGNWVEGKRWVDTEESWVVEAGKRRDRTRITVTGGVQEGTTNLGPIVIEDGGGELNAHYIAKLVAAYEAKGMAYRIVTKSPLRAP